jgi:hypothetical protein
MFQITTLTKDRYAFPLAGQEDRDVEWCWYEHYVDVSELINVSSLVTSYLMSICAMDSLRDRINFLVARAPRMFCGARNNCAVYSRESRVNGQCTAAPALNSP